MQTLNFCNKTSISHNHLTVVYFYHAAWNADTVYQWKSCLSVCPSVKRMHCDKTEERSVQGPDFQKILGKILSLAYVFPKFIESYKVKIFTEF